MRAINIENDKKRDAQVVFDVQQEESKIKMVLPGGGDKNNVKVLKSTVDFDDEALIKKYGSTSNVDDAIIESDPEVDIEVTGKILNYTTKLYVDKNNEIAYSLNLYQVVYNPDGTEKERKDLNKVPGNVNTEIPIKWTGKKFPKDEAIRKFVFTRKYQIRHINGATFDFLFNMAKELNDSNSLMLVGAGTKGNEPILLSRGGQPYRGFLEGRVKDDRYTLILHLSDIELKGIENGTV